MARRGDNEGQPRTKSEKEQELLRTLYANLNYSNAKSSALHKAMKDDTKFAQGEQWDKSDIQELESRGVKAITVNKVKPIVKLLIGIERQAKSDYKILPEGDEDSITAEIVTRLVKNIVKNSRLTDKLSEAFKSGITTGMCFVEPYIDYTFDLLHGDLKFKKITGSNIYLDPDFEEYDLSDSRYMFKVTRGLEKQDLLALFPNDEKKIDAISTGTINFETMSTNPEIASPRDSDYDSNEGYEDDTKRLDTPEYDLIDYYYKDFQTRYYVFFPESEDIKEFELKSKAEEFAAQYEQRQPQILERKVNVIMLCQLVSDVVLFKGLAPTYPKWKTYPIIPYFAELADADVSDLALKIQGIVRGIKDLNIEYNKRRTQELNILNTSQNSGFWIEEGSLSKDEEERLKTRGSSPGFVGKHKRNSKVPTRIQPMVLSQGHAQLAAENSQDLKEASSVNPDLLANDSKSQSGRAKLLQQRQGLVMAQEMLDNYAITRAQLGRYIITQLSELMTVKSATRILGQAFIADNFSTPVNVILERALAKIENEQELSDLEQDIALQYKDVPADQPIVDNNNQLITVTDTDTANQVVSLVLTNADLGKYDIAVTDGVFAETIAMSNFMDLKELAQQGVPIPPQDLIQESQLPDSNKKRIIANLVAQVASAPAEKA